MKRHVVIVSLVIILGSACSDNVVGPPAAPEPTATTAPPSTATTTAPSSKPFAGSVNDVLTQINMQLPILIEDENPTQIPLKITGEGTFGGPVTSDTDVHLIPEGTALDPVAAVVVRTRGTAGAVSTPARLLSGIGASLHKMSVDAVEAFGEDALPLLSSLTERRTTITVGSYYDLTIVVVDTSQLTYIFTPVGVAPPADLT